ncbi:MAG TPA: carboxymuconolactone decarboxylase family protein [Burkholderiales bacterium]|nr:carboxymuconolactone decarboxylase family protein [Burkholderiales bacterium]
MQDFVDRMPPLRAELMDEAQREAAAALTAGPRKGVKGPFIPLLRSPHLMDRLQRVGEYIRFDSSLPPRLSEFAMLVVARAWTQQFEWFTHVPLARKAGTAEETIAALREGRRPGTMHADEALVYDFVTELLAHHGVCDATYAAGVAGLGERGVIDLVGLAGYFVTVCAVLNVAHTPPDLVEGVAPLPALPL